MSLPELLLMLREEAKRDARRALLDLQTEALSAFALWDKESGRRLERLRKLLGEQVEPPQQATTEDLEDVFAAWGAGSG